MTRIEETKRPTDLSAIDRSKPSCISILCMMLVCAPYWNWDQLSVQILRNVRAGHLKRVLYPVPESKLRAEFPLVSTNTLLRQTNHGIIFSKELTQTPDHSHSIPDVSPCRCAIGPRWLLF